jgi:hypothetical protein
LKRERRLFMLDTIDKQFKGETTSGLKLRKTVCARFRGSGHGSVSSSIRNKIPFRRHRVIFAGRFSFVISVVPDGRIEAEQKVRGGSNLIPLSTELQEIPRITREREKQRQSRWFDFSSDVRNDFTERFNFIDFVRVSHERYRGGNDR